MWNLGHHWLSLINDLDITNTMMREVDHKGIVTTITADLGNLCMSVLTSADAKALLSPIMEWMAEWSNSGATSRRDEKGILTCMLPSVHWSTATLVRTTTRGMEKSLVVAEAKRELHEAFAALRSTCKWSTLLVCPYAAAVMSVALYERGKKVPVVGGKHYEIVRGEENKAHLARALVARYDLAPEAVKHLVRMAILGELMCLLEPHLKNAIAAYEGIPGHLETSLTADAVEQTRNYVGVLACGCLEVQDMLASPAELGQPKEGMEAEGVTTYNNSAYDGLTSSSPSASPSASPSSAPFSAPSSAPSTSSPASSGAAAAAPATVPAAVSMHTKPHFQFQVHQAVYHAALVALQAPGVALGEGIEPQACAKALALHVSNGLDAKRIKQELQPLTSCMLTTRKDSLGTALTTFVTTAKDVLAKERDIDAMINPARAKVDGPEEGGSNSGTKASERSSAEADLLVSQKAIIEKKKTAAVAKLAGDVCTVLGDNRWLRVCAYLGWGATSSMITRALVAWIRSRAPYGIPSHLPAPRLLRPLSAAVTTAMELLVPGGVRAGLSSEMAAAVAGVVLATEPSAKALLAPVCLERTELEDAARVLNQSGQVSGIIRGLAGAAGLVKTATPAETPPSRPVTQEPFSMADLSDEVAKKVVAMLAAERKDAGAAAAATATATATATAAVAAVAAAAAPQKHAAAAVAGGTPQWTAASAAAEYHVPAAQEMQRAETVAAMSSSAAAQAASAATSLLSMLPSAAWAAGASPPYDLKQQRQQQQQRPQLPQDEVQEPSTPLLLQQRPQQHGLQLEGPPPLPMQQARGPAAHKFTDEVPHLSSVARAGPPPLQPRQPFAEEDPVSNLAGTQQLMLAHLPAEAQRGVAAILEVVKKGEDAEAEEVRRIAQARATTPSWVADAKQDVADATQVVEDAKKKLAEAGIRATAGDPAYKRPLKPPTPTAQQLAPLPAPPPMSVTASPLAAGHPLAPGPALPSGSYLRKQSGGGGGAIRDKLRARRHGTSAGARATATTAQAGPVSQAPAAAAAQGPGAKADIQSAQASSAAAAIPGAPAAASAAAVASGSGSTTSAVFDGGAGGEAPVAPSRSSTTPLESRAAHPSTSTAALHASFPLRGCVAVGAASTAFGATVKLDMKQGSWDKDGKIIGG